MQKSEGKNTVLGNLLATSCSSFGCLDSGLAWALGNRGFIRTDPITVCGQSDDLRLHITCNQPRSLSFYVEFALANYREPVTQKLLTEAVAEFLVIKDHEREQDLLSEPYLTRVKRDLKRLQKHFPAARVAELTGTRLLGYRWSEIR